MDHIRTLLPSVLRKRGLHGQATASLVVHRAQGWIADHLPEVAGMVLVTKLQDGTLHVDAETSIAAQECQLRAMELQQFIEKECGVTVKEVRMGRAVKKQQRV